MSKIRILKKSSALTPLFSGFYGPTIFEKTDLGACRWPIFMEIQFKLEISIYNLKKSRSFIG